MVDYTYLPETRWLVIGGLLLAAAIFTSYFWAKGRSSRAVRVGLSVLRWVIVALVAGCLFGPEWVEAVKQQQKARVAVLLDSSHSMSIRDLPQERLAAAKDWIQNNLAPATPPDCNLHYFTFDESLVPLPAVDSARAAGESTGLADALENLLAIPGDEPLAGVVIGSDGIENVRPDLEDVAKTFRRKGIPIHTLTVGTTNAPRDIVVENVHVRRVVPNQAPTRVAVVLQTAGCAQQTVPVQVLHEGQIVAVQEVVLTGESQKVELEFTPRQKGFHVYEVRIPAQAGEWLSSNNRRLFGLDVIDPTIRVIYMEGTPQQPESPIPEWKYLKSALESDPNIKVKTLYRAFGATGKRLDVVSVDPETGEKIYPVEHKTKGFPRNLASLLEYDVVIHSDILKESFSAEQLQNMARLVEEFGGGFIMIGGNSAFGKGGYHKTILDRIIPVAMKQEKDSEARPFRMRVVPAAWAHPILDLGKDREETQLIWSKLPQLYGCNLVERAKPGATILGTGPSAPGIKSGRVLLAVQNIGRGRSMAFTSDTTRTWGKEFETQWGEKINPALQLNESNCDSRYYRQFWVNAIRWLAAGRIGRTNSSVSLELAQSYCFPKAKVVAKVTVRDAALREITTADVDLLVSSGGQTNRIAQAVFNAETRSYVAEFALPDPGQFIVTAVAAAKGVPIGNDRQLLVCEAADREMSELRAQPDLMANLARISGGQVLSISAAASGDAVFSHHTPPTTVEYRRQPLWDQPWFLAAILGLLGVEWAVRRLNALA